MEFYIKPWAEPDLTSTSWVNPLDWAYVESVYTNMPVYPNFAYKGTITGKYDGKNAIATS
jgi:hypothetical protein